MRDAGSLFGCAATVTAGPLRPEAGSDPLPPAGSGHWIRATCEAAPMPVPTETRAGVRSGLPVTRATRYIAPLREGGSLPGLVEAEDLGTWVVKFRGAGQGPGALVAEVVAGELGRAMGLPVPELSLIEIPPELGRAEPDPEVKELIEASPGLNLAMDFLPGALPYTGPEGPGVPGADDPGVAAAVVFFDALTTNIDRTPRNPNLLVWHGRTWLIDHGAAFFRQHGPKPLADTASTATPALADHVLLPATTPAALEEAAGRLTPAALEAAPAVVDLVPDKWLGDDPEALREDFRLFLEARLAAPDRLVAELAGYLESAPAGSPAERKRRRS